MERLLKTTFATCLLFASVGCSANGEGFSSDSYKGCPHSSGVGDERTCQVDSYSIISTPQKFCDLRVVTFGYVAVTWGSLSLYPDAARADAQFIYSALQFADPVAVEQVSRNMADGGQFVEVMGEFKCHGDRDPDGQFGVGKLVNIKRVSVFSESDGPAAKENILYFRP